MVRRVTNSAPSSKSSRLAHEQGDSSVEEVTRCICGNDEFVPTPRTKAFNASPGLYVQCETCNVWQHGFCMGFMAEKDVPNDYYCELCQPSFHRIVHRHGVVVSKYTPVVHSLDDSSTERNSNADQAENAASSPDGQNFVKSEDPSKGNSRNLSSGSQSPLESQTSHDHTQEKVEDATIIAENGVSNEQNSESQSPPMSKLAQSTEKRSKRNSGESEANGAPRNRKRRSREDEILQRVLEESAREAREAEARRRSNEGGSLNEDDKSPIEKELNGKQYVSNNDDADDQEPIARPSRSRRARTSASVVDAKKLETSKSGSAGKASRGGRNARGGGRRGARASGNTNENSQTDTASLRRTTNGVKKCKPRIPSPKTTFEEMRRRVSTILEFASKTQDEIHAEQKHGIEALQQFVTANKFDIPFKHLSKMCDRNSAYLEDLTRRLLKWEEHYGVNKSP